METEVTHPTRDPAICITVANAMSQISDREMTEMCLAVNSMFGSGRAGRLLDLFSAARREIAKEGAQP
jgi:hypothetical protein